MQTDLFGEIHCSKGWDRRCAHAKSGKCTCACRGKNHAKLSGTFTLAKTFTNKSSVTINQSNIKDIFDEAVKKLSETGRMLYIEPMFVTYCPHCKFAHIFKMTTKRKCKEAIIKRWNLKSHN